MNISQNGVNLIKQFEGCKLVAYQDAVGVWTIGYGHTLNVKKGDAINQQQAENYLKSDLKKFEEKVMKYYTKYIWTQNEFDALVSFAFNVGSIDKLTANGTRDKKTISAKFLEYNKAGGKVLSGLTRRRQEEQKLFLSNSVISTVGNGTRKTVNLGSTGEDVKYLQQKLDKKGYYFGAIDGVFGQKTLSAVKNFQVNYGLNVDGICGPKTWAVVESL